MACCENTQILLQKECTECFKLLNLDKKYKKQPLKYYIISYSKLLLIKYALTNSLITANNIEITSTTFRGIVSNPPLFELLFNHGILLKMFDDFDTAIKIILDQSLCNAISRDSDVLSIIKPILCERNWKFTYVTHVIFYALEYSRTTHTSKYILENDDCDNARNAEGDTPLIFAIKQGKLHKIIENILNAGADCSLVNNAGYDALYYATIYCDFEYHKLLLPRIGIIKRNDYDDTTLLHMARSSTIFKLLLKHGAAYKKNGKGEYPYEAMIKDDNHNAISAIIEDVHVYDILLL